MLDATAPVVALASRGTLAVCRALDVRKPSWALASPHFVQRLVAGASGACKGIGERRAATNNDAKPFVYAELDPGHEHGALATHGDSGPFPQPAAIGAEGETEPGAMRTSVANRRVDLPGLYARPLRLLDPGGIA